MLKRTPGKWSWSFSQDPETRGKPGIFVEGDGEPLIPQVGDLELMAHAPEMYELLCEVSDELGEAVHQGVITEGVYKIIRKVLALVSELGIERQESPAEIKACPFCGGKAEVEPEGITACGYWLKCKKCGIEQPTPYETAEAAIEAWNRRAEK